MRDATKQQAAESAVHECAHFGHPERCRVTAALSKRLWLREGYYGRKAADEGLAPYGRRGVKLSRSRCPPRSEMRDARVLSKWCNLSACVAVLPPTRRLTPSAGWWWSAPLEAIHLLCSFILEVDYAAEDLQARGDHC
ncbi:MAG: hypothetical protein ACLPJJ_00035, partial [Acidocella sp.]|uniref:hypothetical protein n=1 Tax=Acidocella sp. TaxID=50710 RepID=UPI003FD8C166